MIRPRQSTRNDSDDSHCTDAEERSLRGMDCEGSKVLQVVIVREELLGANGNDLFPMGKTLWCSELGAFSMVSMVFNGCWSIFNGTISGDLI